MTWPTLAALLFAGFILFGGVGLFFVIVTFKTGDRRQDAEPCPRCGKPGALRAAEQIDDGPVRTFLAPCWPCLVKITLPRNSPPTS